VSCGIQVEQLAVKHMGKPGYRMPVAGVVGGKCPPDVVKGKACCNVLIFGYVHTVIEINKLTAQHRPVGKEGNYQQGQINAYC
jgi:hypothetical protein